MGAVICFVVHSQHKRLKTVQPNKDLMPKIRRSITLDKELNAWIQEQIKQKRFKDVSHAIEFSLFKLRETDRVTKRNSSTT